MISGAGHRWRPVCKGAASGDERGRCTGSRAQFLLPLRTAEYDRSALVGASGPYAIPGSDLPLGSAKDPLQPHGLGQRGAPGLGQDSLLFPWTT